MTRAQERWMRRRAKISFRKASLQELCGDYVSPGRGWYHIYTFRPDQQDEEQLRWLPFEDHETIVLLRLDIGAFRSSSIDDKTLAFIQRILTRFAEAGKDIILRILYDVDGRGMVHEPAAFDLVCDHMRSIGSVVAEHAREILLVQGLFVGSWGEMHDSKYLDPKSIRRLYVTWRQATGGMIPISVRKPLHMRILETDDTVDARKKHEKTQLSEKARIGLYDDAILADDTHMGTFGDKTRREASYEESWRAKDEYAFIHKRMNQVPVGGEAIGGKELGSREIVEQLKALPVSYLNSIYQPKVMEHWKALAAPEGESLYAYIGNHMGYRFVVKDVSCKRGRLCITIANDGFAPLYEDARLRLIMVNPQKHRQSRTLNMDLRTITPGTCKLVHADLRKAFCEQFSAEKENSDVENEEKYSVASGYRFYLEMIRSRDRRAIRFANEGADERLWIGSMELRS